MPSLKAVLMATTFGMLGGTLGFFLADFRLRASPSDSTAVTNYQPAVLAVGDESVSASSSHSDPFDTQLAGGCDESDANPVSLELMDSLGESLNFSVAVRNELEEIADFAVSLEVVSADGHQATPPHFFPIVRGLAARSQVVFLRPLATGLPDGYYIVRARTAGVSTHTAAEVIGLREMYFRVDGGSAFPVGSIEFYEESGIDEGRRS